MLRRFDGVRFDDSDRGIKRFLKEYLRRHGFSRIRKDVPLGPRIADISAVKKDALYAFEAKSSTDNIDRAFYQCLDYLMHADFTIIVTTQNMPYRKLRRFCQIGIGVWRVYEPGIVKQIASPIKPCEVG